MSRLYVSTNLLTDSVDRLRGVGVEPVFLFGEELWIEIAHDGMVFMFKKNMTNHDEFPCHYPLLLGKIIIISMI